MSNAEGREPTAATRIAVGLSLAVLVFSPIAAYFFATTATTIFIGGLSAIGVGTVIATGGIATFLGIDPQA